MHALATGGAVWAGAVRPRTAPDLSSCLEQDHVTYRGRPLPWSSPDAEALRLVDWAVAGRRRLAVCPRDPLCDLPALIPAAAHVASMVAASRNAGYAVGSALHIVVITRDYRLRGLYRSLGVSPGPGMGSELLRRVVPAAAASWDGTIRVVDRAENGSWSTIFSRSVAAVRSLRRIDLFVVDLPTDDDDAVLSLPGSVVVIARDVTHPLVERLARDGAVFAWGDADLGVADQRLSPRLACIASGSRCEVVRIAAPAIARAGAFLWEDLGPLVAATQRSLYGRELARETFALFHDLMGLAVPRATYEALAGPLGPRLDAVRRSAVAFSRTDLGELYLPVVESELRDIVEAAGDVPPKASVLDAVVREQVDQRRTVLVVARTASMARAIRGELDASARMPGVRVVSIGALADESPADVAILPGLAPTWARWIYESGIADHIKVLAYDETAKGETAGNTEAAVVARTVMRQRATRVRMADADSKDRCWTRLSGDRPAPRGVAPPPPAADTAEVALESSPSPPDVPPGLWTGDRWLLPLEQAGAFADAQPDREGGRPAADAIVSCVRVTFEDGRWAYLDAAAPVSRTLLGTGHLERVLPTDLRPGDRVVFIDGDARKDLLGKVIEVASAVPALAVASAWLGHWRRVLADLYARLGAYERLRSALARHGCLLQAQTIRLWVVGTTIGPDDSQDVRRVGLVAGDAALTDGYKQVDQAMRSLRGAHSRLGRRLAELTRRVGTAVAVGLADADEIVDETSGLSGADFQDALDIVTVRNIETGVSTRFVVTGVLRSPGDREIAHV